MTSSPSRPFSLATFEAFASRADVSRQQILTAAAALFAKHGYADTSLRDIAGVVGMKAGSLYYHFASKDELATEVLRIGVERVHQAVLSRIRALGEDAPVRHKVEAALAAHLETLWLESDYTSAHVRCIHYVPPGVRQGLRRARRDYETVWRDLVEEAAEASALPQGADPDAVRLAILGALNWSLEWFDPKRHRPDEFARTLAASFVRES